MPAYPKILPDCLSCQYQFVGLFPNTSPNVMADFRGIGKLLTVPPGITLNQKDVLGDRVLVICGGEVRLSCHFEGQKVLGLKDSHLGQVRDISAPASEARLEVAEVVAETLSPSSIMIVRRTDLLAFLGHHGEVSVEAAKSLEAIRICFLGCSEPGLARICSWSACPSCSWLGTTGHA